MTPYQRYKQRTQPKQHRDYSLIVCIALIVFLALASAYTSSL